MITYKEVDKSYLEVYDSVDMLVHVRSIYVLEKINRGLGGFVLKEEPVEEYWKDFRKYEKASDYEKEFDITNWEFFMAFDEDRPVGAATVVSRTGNVNMLEGREDLSVLWDIRVSNDYKHKGIGQKLFDMAKNWSVRQGFKQLKIECQNNNVPACKFYHKQGAVLSKIDEYAYYKDVDIRNEVQFIWYLEL